MPKDLKPQALLALEALNPGLSPLSKPRKTPCALNALNAQLFQFHPPTGLNIA